MIAVNVRLDGITVSGHAGYSEHGKDIICSAVSTLTQNLIYSIEQLTKDKITYVIKPGTVDIKFRDLSEYAQLLVDSFFIGVCSIADSYPDYVKIT